MRQHLKITVLLVLAVSLIFAGCGKLFEEEEESFSCPSINDNVTFTRYGPLKIQDSGRDSTARKIIRECGWHVYNGHNGGYGDTLEIASPGEEVVLRWAWNDFHWMYLNSGWNGRTAEGIGMGDTLYRVRSAYPGLTSYYDGSYKLANIGGDPSSSAYFYFDLGVLVGIDIY